MAPEDSNQPVLSVGISNWPQFEHQWPAVGPAGPNRVWPEMLSWQTRAKFNRTNRNERFALEHKVGFMPLFGNGASIETGIFTFPGVTFLLYVEEEGTLELKDVVLNGESLANAGSSYHVRRLGFKIGKYLSQQLTLKWLIP